MPIVSNFPSGVLVDNTLSVSGKAADAAIVGSRLSAIDLEVGDLDDLETTDKSSLVAAINEANQNGGSSAQMSTLTLELGGVTYTYNGSADVTITIADADTSLY